MHCIRPGTNVVAVVVTVVVPVELIEEVADVVWLDVIDDDADVVADDD